MKLFKGTLLLWFSLTTNIIARLNSVRAFLRNCLKNRLERFPGFCAHGVFRYPLRPIIIMLALGCMAVGALGQSPVIASFAQNGQLICTNLQPGSTASVEWASSVLGPWTNNWAGLEAVTVDSNGLIQVRVPMFYRVRCLPPFNSPSNMVWIPAGTFIMGSPDSEPTRSSVEGPQTRVTISYGFCMGKYELTQEEYLAIMGSNPSYFNGDRSGPPYYDRDYGIDLNRPVENVSWSNAVAYCEAVTLQERNAGRLPAGYSYRLPTEAEWEFACRAGTTAPFHYGNELHSGMANFDGHKEYPPCGDSSWYCTNSSGINLGRATTVGSYAPNAWGLYDMHGNVWEWCQDMWCFYPGGNVTDPQCPATGSDRLIRGGGWGYTACYCRSAFRYSLNSTRGYSSIGFRVVLAPSAIRVNPSHRSKQGNALGPNLG